MGKGSNRQKKPSKNPKFNGRPRLQQRANSFREENMDDEIDAFHKQRDVVPIDINRDAGDASDEDDEQPVFDFEGGDQDTDDNNSDSKGDDDDDDAVFAHDKEYARMLRQKKILQQKYGGLEDDVLDDPEQEEEQKAFFGRGKQYLYGADNIDFEIQSDEEDLAEEEAIAVMSQKEKAKSLSMEDFGLEDTDKEASDVDDNDREKYLQDLSIGKDSRKKFRALDTVQDDTFENYEEIKKDLSALSQEEQMDIVYSSAPELVGLLSELNEATSQLYKVKALLCKAKETKGALDYLETKHKLLLAYLQAISFYLLLKSEGQPVRDHPVIARLVEIKNLWEKVKSMDGNISSQVEEAINHVSRNDTRKIVVKENFVPEIESAVVSIPAKAIEASKVSEFINSGLSKEDNSSKRGNQKPQNEQVGQQSLEMLKVRASLEEKLKKKGVFNSIASKTGKVHHALETGNRHLETLANFDDDITDGRVHRGLNSEVHKFASAKVNKPMFVSGDDDLPMREDLGEKRIKYVHTMVEKAEKQRKRELLEKIGVGDDIRAVRTKSQDGDEMLESEDEFYKEVKRQRLTKLSAKATLYTRTPTIPQSEELGADGKRQITYQMEKNKGLTRNRKKLTKTPRKKYKLKHQKAVVRRKGQVRDIRKPTGPYGGEASGINTRVSRSVRFKS